VIGLGLRQLEEVVSAKADALQRVFSELSTELDDLGKLMLELRGDEKQAAREKQKELREKQRELAEAINEWRARARGVRHQSSITKLVAFLDELALLEEPEVNAAIEHTRMLIESGGEQVADEQPGDLLAVQTPAQRLIERARTDYLLRGPDVGVREREAVMFANRTGMAQDDAALAELEEALDDGDVLVKEVAYLTVIQLLRSRAIQFADLDEAHRAVKRLVTLDHPAVIPVLIEIVESPRSGYVRNADETVESDNTRTRLIALLRLVEWHTADAEAAVRSRLRDRDKQIVQVAMRALDLFPDPWSGPLKKPKKQAP